MFAVEDDSIQYLIDKEKENALKYGKFHSEHEFYSIIKEEIEEASFDMSSIENELEYLWKDIKLDHMREEEINTIKKHSIYAIHELLQVCAVCDKQLDKNKTREEEFEEVKQIIQENIDNGKCGIFNTKNIAGDKMTTIYVGKYFTLEFCFDFKYFEVFGTTWEEFKKLKEYYYNLLEGEIKNER